MKAYDLTFQAMGASTVVIPYADLYMSLKTGVVDGQDNPFGNVTSMKFYEVQKYFTVWNYVYDSDLIIANSKVWDNLEPATQELLAEKAKEACEWGRKEGCEALKELK